MRNGSTTRTRTVGRSRVHWPTAAGLLVALGGPPTLAAVSSRLTGESASLAVPILLQLIFCGLAVIVVRVVLRYERLPLGSIGLRRPDWTTIGTALLLFCAGFLLLPIVVGPVVRAWAQAGIDAGLAALAGWPPWFRVFVAVTGGFVEETLYRGYAVERLTTLVGRRWLGATLATLAFAAAHIPLWGVAFAIAADLPAGIVLVLFYLWRRDLLANALAHSMGLLVALLTMTAGR